MVIERVNDSEHSIIDVVHIMYKKEIEAINLPEEKVHELEIEEVKKELLEDYPSYSLVFATKTKEYANDDSFGPFMIYTARGVKYYLI